MLRPSPRHACASAARFTSFSTTNGTLTLPASAVTMSNESHSTDGPAMPMPVSGSMMAGTPTAMAATGTPAVRLPREGVDHRHERVECGTVLAGRPSDLVQRPAGEIGQGAVAGRGPQRDRDHGAGPSIERDHARRAAAVRRRAPALHDEPRTEQPADDATDARGRQVEGTGDLGPAVDPCSRTKSSTRNSFTSSIAAWRSGIVPFRKKRTGRSAPVNRSLHAFCASLSCRAQHRPADHARRRPSCLTWVGYWSTKTLATCTGACFRTRRRWRRSWQGHHACLEPGARCRPALGRCHREASSSATRSRRELIEAFQLTVARDDRRRDRGNRRQSLRGSSGARACPSYALSNWSAETFPIARRRFAFLDWFAGIVISGEVGSVKPDRRDLRAPHRS